MKILCKQKGKTFFLSALIALNIKWVPRFNEQILMKEQPRT